MLVPRTRHPFIGLTVAAIVGIAAADYFPTAGFVILPVTALGLLVTLMFPFTPLFFAVVSATFFCLHNARITHTPAQELAEFAGAGARPVTAHGIVVTEPNVEPNGVAVFTLHLHSLEFGIEKFATSASVLVRWRRTPRIGDEVELFGTLQSIEPARNPGEFDRRAYLARRGVNHLLIIRYPENGRVIRTGSEFSLLRAAARSRDWMQRTLGRGIEDSPGVIALICGTALGQRHQTQDDIEEPFQQTGTLHLFAVAGLHVGIVAWLLWTVATILRLPRKLATAIIIPLLFFYAAITGLHTASIRAAIMLAIFLAAIFFDRKVFALNSLAAAAFLILLGDSNQLFTSGFQLSFCVVGTIILLADPLFVFLRRMAEPDPFLPRSLLGPGHRGFISFGNALARGASISIAAWIGSLPLIYWYFHLITPISLFANLAVVPVAYVVLALAMLSLITAPISSAMTIIFNNANWLVSKFLLFLVGVFAAVPLGHVYLPRFTQSHPPVAITVLDQGTGAATYVSANRYNWLADCGSARTYERSLKAFLHAQGVNRLEGLLLTHGDAQHIGGAAATIADFNPREIYFNPLDVRSSTQRQLLATISNRRNTARPLRRGDSLLFGPDVRAEVLYPPPGIATASADDAPLILRLTCRQTAVLLESDAGIVAENALVQWRDNLRSDILVKGQHHTGSSGSPAFIDAVRPELIIATSRESPIAERVNENWINSVAEKQIKLFRQDVTGAIEIDFDEARWAARAYLTGETFRSKSR